MADVMTRLDRIEPQPTKGTPMATMSRDADAPSSRSGRSFDVAAFIDGRRLSPFNRRLILLSWLITLFDGFDMQVVAFTAPYMRDELHLTTRMLGNVFSAGTFGMVLGGLGFSYIGDRVGRRPTVLVTAFLFGILTIGLAFAKTYPQLLAMRFVDGLAIGGMLPLAWALNIEFVPKHMRALVVTIIMMGYSLGSAIGGPLTNLIAPTHGWQGVYIVGGVGSLLSATALLVFLPESVRFLVARGRRPDVVAATLKRIEPTLDVRADDRFVLADETKATRNFTVGQLFHGRLAPITLLLWSGYLVSSLGIYFSSSWGPTVLESLHYPRSTAALVSSLAGILGAIAGILLMKLTEHRGPGWIAIFPVIATPLLLAIGFGLMPAALFLPGVVLGALLIGGEHSALISITGIYYPSAIRSSGGGWAASVGKAGGVLGPIVGAVILSSGLPVLRSYAFLAFCPLVLGACMLLLAGVVKRRVALSPAPDVVPAS